MSTRQNFSRPNPVVLRLFLLFLIGLGLYLAGQFGLLQTPGEEATQGDPWLTNLRTYAEEGRFYLYAVKLFNGPVGCEGEITDTFDGMQFGRLRFAFAGGGELLIETFPPESSRTALRAPRGFPDEEEARAVLAQEVREIGLRLDWSRPEEETAGETGLVTIRYWDRHFDNAAAFLVYQGAKLIEIGYSLAL